MADEPVNDIDTWRGFLAGFGFRLSDGKPMEGNPAGITAHHIEGPYETDVYVYFTAEGNFWCLIGEG